MTCRGCRTIPVGTLVSGPESGPALALALGAVSDLALGPELGPALALALVAVLDLASVPM